MFIVKLSVSPTVLFKATENKTTMKNLLLIAFILLSGIVFAQNSANVTVGDQALPFSGKTVEGNNIQLEDLYKNNPVVFVMLRGWPGYQCPICTKQVGGLVEDAEKFQNAGATVLMVYPGPSEELVEHANEFSEDFTFPSHFYFILDPDYSITNLYGLRWDAPNETAYPSTFIVNKNGEIVFAEVSSSHGGRAENDEILRVLNQLK